MAQRRVILRLKSMNWVSRAFLFKSPSFNAITHIIEPQIAQLLPRPVGPGLRNALLKGFGTGMSQSIF
ncbi:MAG: hypothetical protein OET90_04090, partial [Desulfuromonadales bacterium]|nr:hypothetical protein [Desulfuromonadales bacterium]